MARLSAKIRKSIDLAIKIIRPNPYQGSKEIYN